MQVTNVIISKKTFLYTNLNIVMIEIRKIQSRRVMYYSIEENLDMDVDRKRNKEIWGLVQKAAKT